jgi:hypothetical protein
VKAYRDRHVPRLGGGVRAPITQFTNASRKKLLLRMAQAHDIDNGLFVTLTYPNRFPDDPLIFKRDLAVWIKRLKRKYPAWRGLWRLEFQVRGAPHYHLLLFGIPDKIDLGAMRAWVSRTWFAVVGSGDEKHLRAGTNVRKIENRAHAMRYASKYCAKGTGQDKQGRYGRRWGAFGAWDFTADHEIPLSWGQWVEVQRLIVKWCKTRTLKSAIERGERLRGLDRNRSAYVFGLGAHSQGARTGAYLPYDATTIARMVESVNAQSQHRAAFAPDGHLRWMRYLMEKRRRFVDRYKIGIADEIQRFRERYSDMPPSPTQATRL